MNENVVELSKVRAQKKEGAKKKVYREYLTLLENNQLENEINHLLDSVDDDTCMVDLAQKSELILAELAGRTAHPVNTEIKKMQRDIQTHLE